MICFLRLVLMVLTNIKSTRQPSDPSGLISDCLSGVLQSHPTKRTVTAAQAKQMLRRNEPLELITVSPDDISHIILSGC